MTTVTDANVHNVAVKGTFDDCQVCANIESVSIDSRFWHLSGHREGALR